jgi:hypothetical protein
VTVDVPHLQRQELAPTQPRAIERHEHRAVVEVLRSGNEPPHFIRTQNGGRRRCCFGVGRSSFMARRLSTRT